MTMRTLLTLTIALPLLLASCKKEGTGGDAAITGSVHVEKWNSTFTQRIGEYPGRDLYVYIVYGVHDGYDKRIKTDYNGRFEFPYLYKGNYTVYTYSRDSTFSDASGVVALIKEVSIGDRKETVDLEPFIVFE